MKKIFLSVFGVFLALSIYGCALNLENSSKNLNIYTANLTYDSENHQISGIMEFDFTNQTNTSLQYLEFNIYPNAFREDSNQDVISLSKYTECYYNGLSYGGITINSVECGELILNFSLEGVDENVLKVNLNAPLHPTKNIVITIDLTISLPNISHRFGYGENTINLGNFLPTLCVFENGEWVEIEYNSNGDPFYSEVANYYVNFEYPSKYTLASTGEILQTSDENEIKISQIEAKSVRDFAVVLCDKFQVLTDTTNDITVNYYYYNDEYASESLATSVLAVKTFNSLFGKYPYPTLNIVQANFCIGGMEFPNIVLISDLIQNYEDLQYVIVHEIAHQWWYGVVGNNQSKYAWLDEGLAEYSTALFYENNDNYETTYETLLSRANTSLSIYQTVYTNVLGDADTSMNRTLAEYKSETEYVYTAYIKGFLLFDSLSSLLSEKVVVKCLKNYFITYAFEISTPELLIASFEKTTSCNLEGFFDSWINGKVVSFE